MTPSTPFLTCDMKSIKKPMNQIPNFLVSSIFLEMKKKKSKQITDQISQTPVIKGNYLDLKIDEERYLNWYCANSLGFPVLLYRIIVCTGFFTLSASNPNINTTNRSNRCYLDRPLHRVKARSGSEKLAQNLNPARQSFEIFSGQPSLHLFLGSMAHI